MREMKFYTKDGRPTDYALSCGYIELHKEQGVDIILEKESGVYHVKKWSETQGRVLWESYDTLAEARKAFDALSVALIKSRKNER